MERPSQAMSVQLPSTKIMSPQYIDKQTARGVKRYRILNQRMYTLSSFSLLDNSLCTSPFSLCVPLCSSKFSNIFSQKRLCCYSFQRNSNSRNCSHTSLKIEKNKNHCKIHNSILSLSILPDQCHLSVFDLCHMLVRYGHFLTTPRYNNANYNLETGVILNFRVLFIFNNRCTLKSSDVQYLFLCKSNITD